MTGSGQIMKIIFAPDVSVVENDVALLTLTNVKFFNGPGEVASSASPGQITFGPNLPTAAGAMVSGRVTDTNGRPISRAELLLTDNSGNIRRAISSPLGYFKFVDVPSGTVYILSASARRFVFHSRAVSVDQDLADADLIGGPN
jgi:hypothetical protein